MNAAVLQLCRQFRSCWVHGDALLGDQHVDGAARGGLAEHVVRYDGKSCAGQRCDDHRKLCACSGVGVTPGAAHDLAAGIGMYVYVEVGIDLRCAQQDHVQGVHSSGLRVGAGIAHGGNFRVLRVGADGFHRLQVEALHVDEALEAALIQHVHHVAGDAAAAKAALDAFLQHDLLEELGRCQGSAAGAGLEGEAVL